MEFSEFLFDLKTLSAERIYNRHFLTVTTKNEITFLDDITLSFRPISESQISTRAPHSTRLIFRVVKQMLMQQIYTFYNWL